MFMNDEIDTVKLEGDWGDNFLRAGFDDSAIASYSEAINQQQFLSDDLVYGTDVFFELYVGRAHAYLSKADCADNAILQAECYAKVIEDCGKALDMKCENETDPAYAYALSYYASGQANFNNGKLLNANDDFSTASTNFGIVISNLIKQEGSKDETVESAKKYQQLTQKMLKKINANSPSRLPVFETLSSEKSLTTEIKVPSSQDLYVPAKKFKPDTFSMSSLITALGSPVYTPSSKLSPTPSPMSSPTSDKEEVTSMEFEFTK